MTTSKPAEEANVLAGCISKISFLGSVVECVIDVQSGPTLRAAAAPDIDFAEGMQVWVRATLGTVIERGDKRPSGDRQAPAAANEIKWTIARQSRPTDRPTPNMLPTGEILPLRPSQPSRAWPREVIEQTHGLSVEGQALSSSIRDHDRSSPGADHFRSAMVTFGA